MMAIKSSAVVQ